jgi:hypothetical protein
MIRTIPLVLVFALAACAPPVPPPPQRFAFHVYGDPDEPLPGAQLRLRGSLLTTSDAAGVATFAMNGREGETFDVSVECPAGYKSPAQSTTVTMSRLVSTDQVAEFDVLCPPDVRTVVVAVKADKSHRLPVMLLGREIARTDESGVATVLLHPEPQEQIELMLNTNDKDNAALRPQNPTATFVVKNRDDVFVFDPHFTIMAKRAPPPRPMTVGKGPPIPIRIH